MRCPSAAALLTLVAALCTSVAALPALDQPHPLAIADISTRASSPAPPSVLPSLQRRRVWEPNEIEPPRTDPFYLRPANVSLYKPGDVIRARVVNAAYTVANAGRVTQIAYRSTNTQGHPSVSVTTVIEPAKGTQPKMLSYHVWEDATNRNCAPSYTILKGAEAPNIKVLGDDVPVWFAFLLRNGISVVVPDYEGPKSALFAGFQAGYAILDSARAVKNHLGWPADAKVSMTGYSEGAHVTAWAANLAPSYAPELNIVGVTHGGTPIDMELSLRHFDNTSFSGFTLGGMHGIRAAYPKFNRTLIEHAEPSLLKALDEIYAPPVCHAILRGPKYAGQPYMSMLRLPSGDPYNDPVVRHVLKRETLWANKSSVGVGYPKFPRMIYHGRHDDVISFEAVQAYVDQQCARPGVQIEFNVYEANAHTAPQLVLGGDLNAMRFVLEVMETNGRMRNPVPCGMPTPSLLNLLSISLTSLLGGDILAGLRGLEQQAGNAGFENIGFGSGITALVKALQRFFNLNALT